MRAMADVYVKGMDNNMEGLFSAEYYSGIKAAFEGQMALLEGAGKEFLSEKKKEILETLGRCTEQERQALTFLYSAMPMSDLVDYPAALFLAYAKHGVFLWDQGAFVGCVPENIFANYVLHYRVNNEDIADTRGFFYDRITKAVGDRIAEFAAQDKAGRVGGHDEGESRGAMYRTALEVNYWCAREATYRASDGRTQNPRTMYGTAMGRCGEESTLAVTALRSIGIPARQIYAPLWTHCDDNHAWVEAWCDGKWHFLGACEPEERLDLGWFIEPASRAMILHSRWFGKDVPEDPQVGPKGMARVLNHMDRYAYTGMLKVKAVDEEGRPVPGARVDLQVANHGELGSVALVQAGTEGEDCGIVRVMTGFGDLYISASGVSGSGENGKMLYGENMVSLGGNQDEAGVEADDRHSGGSHEGTQYKGSICGCDEAECVVVLKKQPECWEGWRELDFNAPGPCFIHDTSLTEEQQATGKQRLAQATEYRQKKAEGFYDAREADRVLGRFEGKDREQVEEILRRAHSNMGEIVRFLEWDADPAAKGSGQEHWKLEVLKTLREKDYWDTKAEILLDCSINSMPYAGTVPEEIFFRYLACPRVSNEMLRPCRRILLSYLQEDVKDKIRKDPECLPELVDGWVTSMPGQEYENLITSSAGCIRSGIGSRHSKEVLCVNLYRSLGIPARLSHFDGRLEYYRDGGFAAAGDSGEESCRLTLCTEGALKLSDWEHYSLERFKGERFERLGLWGKIFSQQDSELELQLRPGIYRILTLNRKKDGSQLAKMAVFALKNGESKRVTLSLRDIPVEDLLTRTKVEDFALHRVEGGSVSLSELSGENDSGNGKALFLWLEVTREPTEHILNELYERKEDFAGLNAPVYVVLKSKEDLENATLRRTMEALPAITPLLDDFGENYRKLAETVGREVGKLPLAVVLEAGQECIYSDAGYNVGLADILWRILS